MTDTAIEERDEAIAEALVAGRSVRSVRKEFNLTLDEIDAIIARTWPVDNRARVRMIMTDLGLLDRLIAEFYQRALASEDATSAAFATVAIKAMERKHDLTGMSAATRIDLTVTSAPVEPTSSWEKLHAMILRIGKEGDQPDADGGNGAGADGADGAVGALSDSDDGEPSH